VNLEQEDRGNRTRFQIWFRRSPATFDEMIDVQDPERFWIVDSGIPVDEYSPGYPYAFQPLFFKLRQTVWMRDSVQLKLGHTDMIVMPGKRRLGAVLVNHETTPIPWDRYTQSLSLGARLKLVPLGVIR